MKMKKRYVIKSISLLLLAIVFVSSLASCSKAPELALIKPEIERLINASHEVNDIFFGKGLEVDERLETPYENYMCVSLMTEIQSIAQIKELAESVYTKAYLEPLYEVTFTGKYDAVAGGIVRARYMESEGYLLKHCPDTDDGSDPNNILGDAIRTYDFSSIKIIKPSREDFVTFTISTTKNNVTEEITLAVEKTELGWRLDYPTY